MARKSWLVAFGMMVAAALGILQACVGDDPVTAVPDDGDAAGGGHPDADPGDGGGKDGSNPLVDAADGSCQTTTGKLVGARAFGFVGTNASATGTSNGGYVLVGDFRMSATYGDAAPPMIGIGNTEDGAVVRFNPDGTVMWQQHFGGDGSDRLQGVTVDDKDDVYFTGYFSSATFSIGSSTFGPGDLGIVAKLDGKTGNPIWAKKFIPGTFGYGCSAIDFDSGRLVVGCSMGLTQTYESAGGGTAVLAGSQVSGAAVYGLDPATGGVLWGKGLGTSAGADASAETYVNSIDVTPTGTVVAGTFSGGSLTEKQTNAITVPQIGVKTNGFVTELSAQNPALPLWAKGIGDTSGTGFVGSVSAAGTSASGIVVGGSFSGTVSFGGAAHASVGQQDAFVMMLLNKAGAPAWDKFFGGPLDETLRRVRLDACGRPEALFLAHSVLATTDGILIPAPQANGVASILTKLQPGDGTLLWAKGVTPGGNVDLNGINQYDFWVGGKGNAVVVGDFRGSIDLGDGTPVTANGGSHPYLIEYGP